MTKTLIKLALTFLVLPLVFLTSGVLKPQVAHAKTADLVIIVPINPTWNTYDEDNTDNSCTNNEKDHELSDNEEVFLSILTTCVIVFFIVDFIRQRKR